MYIPSLEDLAVLKSVFDLAQKVFHYFSNPSARQRLPQKARASAVISTLTEWENLLISVQPEIAEEIFKLRGLPYIERSRQLENLVTRYSCSSSLNPPSIPTFSHTKIISAPGGDTLVYFGESNET